MRSETKRMRALAAVLLVGMLLLAACGQKPENPGAGGANSPGQNEAGAHPPGGTSPAPSGKPAEQGKTAGADVFAKTIEASAKLESFSVAMNTKQTIEQAGTKTDIQSKIDMDVIMKPQMSFKQALAMNMAGQEMKMDMYLTKDGFYMQNAPTGQWMKLPREQMDQLMGGLTNAEMDPSKQLEKLKQFADDFAISESGGDYVVKLSATGDKFNDFLKNELKESMGGNPQLGDVLNQSMSAVSFKQVEYTYTVDKKTYNPKSMKVSMDMEMDIQGQKMRLVQTIDGAYSNYNAIKEIVVPKEALEAQAIGTM